MKQIKAASQEEVFRNLPIPAALRVMIVPAVTSQLIVLIYNMADTFYVGQTNNPYMVASTSLILPVFNITLCLAGLAGIGGGALIARLLGEEREDEAKRVSAFSLYLGMVIAAVFSLGMGLFMEPILKLLGANANTYEFARQYAACVIVVGGIPTVLSNVLSNLIRSIGRSPGRQASALSWAVYSTLPWTRCSCLCCCPMDGRCWEPELRHVFPTVWRACFSCWC